MPDAPKPLVGIVMGSKSDLPVMKECVELLKRFGIPHEVSIISAHRTPGVAREYAMGARTRGLELMIAGAGMAAHLPGVLASWTTLPIIGVPLASGALNGVDALYAIVQMPPGIPVATVAIGSAGARNAACLAAQILGLKHPAIAQAYEDYRREMAHSALPAGTFEV
jgi:5-(carboxyamino)imidazole ribonucleotide mutase